ncbi:hypothetical protein BH24PSE1_BH24PSE1_03570 [soil metagenome]
MADEIPPAEESPQERKRLNIWLIVALVAAVAAGILLASSVWQGSWKGGESDGNEVAEARGTDLQSWCAAQATYDAIRNELFRRAAQVRGSDEQAYTRLADYALLRISGPLARDTDEELRSVTCSGAATLDLPPGVAVAGGRRSLAGDIEYLIQPAADGTGNVIRLGNADSIVVPLATLSRQGAPQGTPLQVPELPTAGTDQQEPVVFDERQAPEPEDDQPSSSPTTANPSFNCASARTRSEVAVCGDPGLAALDRQMASQFNGALSGSDSRQRALLQRTRGRFLGARDSCRNNECVAETYRGRMREISDIMAGRWRG